MDMVNQHNINAKINALTDSLNDLISNTMKREQIYVMTERLKILKMTQIQYHVLVFENELFDILLKNNYAIVHRECEANTTVYADIKYPFSVVICSPDGKRASINVSNIGIVMIKFILYLRMLNQNVGLPDCPNSFLAVNMNVLPFGRVCLDIDYKQTLSIQENEEYKRFIEQCFAIVVGMTTMGNVIMTKNCITANTPSFHLITEQQFDAITRQILIHRIAERIRNINGCVKIDDVYVWMMPFGRGHTPVRKYIRKTNDFVDLEYPYTEVDFELSMPFDLSRGTDNIHTLYNIAFIDDHHDNRQDDTENYDILQEFDEDDDKNESIVQNYNIPPGVATTENIHENMQLLVKILSFRHNFMFRRQYRRRYTHDYLTQVFGHRYNNFFTITTNKKLLFQNNWQIPKVKPKQRPTEQYEIYRFINAQFLHGITTVEDLFKLMPNTLVKKNVNIGDIDQLQNEEAKNRLTLSKRPCVKRKFTATLDNFVMETVERMDVDVTRNIAYMDDVHPWAYITDGYARTTNIALPETKKVFEYFHKTLKNNVYPYEKIENIMDYFSNIQSMLDTCLKEYIDALLRNFLNSEPRKIQYYMLPMYEFFCKLHYIDACINQSEYNELQSHYPVELFSNDANFERYRNTYVEMTPSHKVYAPFPYPGTQLHRIWPQIDPVHKVILHTIYMMVVEHNYTSVFFYLHNITKKSGGSQLICSLMLNILDQSTATETRYASKEFLNFIYMTFINGGINFECGIINENIQFNLINLQAYISDMQLMFIASPMWFFLANYHYVNERMDVRVRFELFLQIFQCDSSHSPDQQRAAENAQPPASKQPKNVKTLNHDKLFKAYNIKQASQGDLLSIFCHNIMSLCKTENGEYYYDEIYYVPFNMIIPNTIHIQRVTDPIKYSTVYRFQYGIYNSWTMQLERCTSVLYTQITIENGEFSACPHLFNAYNEDIYKIIVNRFLKGITFTRILNYQKNLGLLLAPIYDPNNELNATLNYNIDSIQINIHDLSSSDFILPDEMYVDILRNKNKLYEMFKWLYCIVCHYSESYSCIITTPGSFIPKSMIIDGVSGSGGNGGGGGVYGNLTDNNDEISSTLQTNENIVQSDATRGDKLIQRIHRVLEMKKREQRENITDELQKLSQRELTSLIILFDNTFISGDTATRDELNGTQSTSSASSSSSSIVTSPSNVCTEEVCKFNLSSGGHNNDNLDILNFFESDDFTENSKNKLLMSIFNRRLNNEITQMSIDNFEKIIEENHSRHIIKFVLTTLSWFIRTLHKHDFSDTIFFREIQQHRQLLYDELSDLIFKHNGYFMYNNRITDITTLFATYCRNVKLTVEPAFEMSLPIDQDLYLDYDAVLENRVSRDIVKDIEDACVSVIYQGQFIEDTIVDLSRLWCRVTVPRNKHRISPIFTLHTATGKSEYVNERCRRHFHNAKHTNSHDASSLKVSADNRGTDMAPELNANLIMFVEEFSVLKDKFKQICGHSALTYKHLYTDSKVVYQNNATIILATNNDPKCTEEAVIARLHVYPRRIQYATMKNYKKFPRNTMCATTSNLEINNIMTVQMIMEKMPRVLAENFRGNFMLIWLLKRFFLFNILDPVTINASETLQNHNNGFLNMINAQEMVLERLELNAAKAMSLSNFRRLVNRICEENRSLFNSKIDTYNVFTILNDKLKPMIDTETQTIRVAEKRI